MASPARMRRRSHTRSPSAAATTSRVPSGVKQGVAAHLLRVLEARQFPAGGQLGEAVDPLGQQ